MKIVFIGNCDYNTGPSNVNKDFKKYLSQSIYFLKHTGKLRRAMETLCVTLNAKTVIISGLSIINNVALFTANLTGKNVVYLMHGCYAYEANVNKYELSKRAIKNECLMLASAKKIVAVSELYMNWAKEYFPEYTDKFTYINNGIEWSNYKKITQTERNPYMILSMGGGRPQKNNIVICEAVRVLNEKYGLPFKFVVLGRDYADTEAIQHSPYTNYVGQVSKEEVEKWLKKASIYIQNSSFESFGLAPIEALCSGCNLLISKNVGAISVMSTIREKDVIQNCMNPDEIANKILIVYKNGNYERLLSGIDRLTTSCEYSSKRLLEITKKCEE